jgi:PII-like signaling protein
VVISGMGCSKKSKITRRKKLRINRTLNVLIKIVSTRGFIIKAETLNHRFST